MTNEYRRSSHSTYSLHIHIAWITKYRYKVLKGEIAEDVKRYLRRICVENNVEIISGAISLDHIHMLVSIDPSISVSKLVKYLKGKSSRHLQLQFPELKKRYWGQHLWARGYFAVSTGNVTTDMIKDYIEHHFEDPEEKEDAFRIEP